VSKHFVKLTSLRIVQFVNRLTASCVCQRIVSGSLWCHCFLDSSLTTSLWSFKSCAGQLADGMTSGVVNSPTAYLKNSYAFRFTIGSDPSQF